MAETKLPVKNESKNVPVAAGRGWYPFGNLRREIDRLFEDFDGGFWGTRFAPFAAPAKLSVPPVDIAEKDGTYEITAELPGMDEKNVEVKLANGGLTIKGEKKEEKEEKRKDYHLSERSYGAFERYFALPDGIDTDKISASFKNGVLTVTLPKTAEAQKKEKKIDVKSA